MNQLKITILALFLLSLPACSDNADNPVEMEEDINLNVETLLITGAGGPGSIVFILSTGNPRVNPSNNQEIIGEFEDGFVFGVFNNDPQSDFSGTYMHQTLGPDLPSGSFNAFTFFNATGFSSIANNFIEVTDGILEVDFNQQTQEFSLDYTLTTVNGIIEGFYEGGFEVFEGGV